jgi:hypothetical protein
MSRVPEGVRHRVAAGAVAVVLAGCLFAPSPTPSPTPSLSPTTSPSPSLAVPTPSGSQASVEPTATPEPPLSLPYPESRDRRQIRVEVDPNVGGNGGEIVVRVTNLSDRLIRELVLRWPSELDQTLFLAPFLASQERIAEGGPPLIQIWTKWVLGPGEHGEPAGTISLGWGPLLADSTLTIPIQVSRVAQGEVAFDLQLLAGEAILSLQDGSRAELRVRVQ